MGLFQLGDFKLASGRHAAWKIECDALTADDWAALAKMAADILPPFGRAVGVPRGGLPFAAAMQRYVTPAAGLVVVCEDVVTTGGSITRFVEALEADIPALPTTGVCVFARGDCPDWVRPLFRWTGV